MPTEEETYRKTIEQSLVRLEGKVDNGFAGTFTRQDKTNGRVSALERWQSYSLGFGAAVTLLLIPILIYATKTLLHL